MKTVAISLQLFYYISEMENNYIKRNYMEQKKLRDEIIAAARREISGRSQMDDITAMDIIVHETFEHPRGLKI